jgi:hypothetical protein
MTSFATLAFAHDIKTDYDRSADFSKYKTYMWINVPRPENPLMTQRIIEAINEALAAKGLTLVSENADLGVSANATTRDKRTLETFYGGFPGWGWQRPNGTPTAIVETYQIGTLVVDLFDTRTRRVAWWGSVANSISKKPDKNMRRLNKAVRDMFEKYPPAAARRETEGDRPRPRPVLIEEIWETAKVR